MKLHQSKSGRMAKWLVALPVVLIMLFAQSCSNKIASTRKTDTTVLWARISKLNEEKKEVSNVTSLTCKGEECVHIFILPENTVSHRFEFVPGTENIWSQITWHLEEIDIATFKPIRTIASSDKDSLQALLQTLTKDPSKKAGYQITYSLNNSADKSNVKLISVTQGNDAYVAKYKAAVQKSEEEKRSRSSNK